jgi:O-antigen/teichoic acid export membrane protein
MRPERNPLIRRAIGNIRAGMQHRLAKDTASLTAGQLLRLVLQAIYFVTVARCLGPQQYGAFVAMAAIVAIVAPFAGMGGSNILLKNVSRDRSLLALYWGNGLVLTLVSGLSLSGIVLVCGPFFVGRRLIIPLLLVCVSDLILIRIVDLASFALSAVGRMAENARLNVYMGVARLAGVLVLVETVKHPGVREWTVAYLGGSMLSFSYAFIYITSISGIRISLSRMKEEITESSYFAVSGSAATIYNDIDKTMLARLSDFLSTGIYSAAYRLIDVSMAPVRGMASAAYPEFFRRGHYGPKATREYAGQLIKRTGYFGLAIFFCLFIGAPVLPYVLGSGFRSSVEATRWLAVIPLLRCVHVFLGDALSGAGYQGTRTGVQVGVGGLNILLNVYFIERWSWRGAAWTSVMCDSLLLVSFWVALKWACRNAQRIGVVGIPSGRECHAANNAGR